MKSLSTPVAVEMQPSQKVEISERRIRQQSQKTALIFWGFVGPLILGLIVFFYIPILWGIVLSFGDARATITPTRFVGFQNYITMLTDPNFIHSLVTFGIFAVIIVPTT